MQIIIIGCGNVGGTIARALVKEGHNITVIDPNERAVRDLTGEIDIMGIVGNGASLEALEEANVKTSDLIIAVTDADEKNLFCCLIAKKAGAVNTIARVRNPEYKSEIEFVKEDLGLSMFVNPEYDAAEEIARLLRFPSAIEIDTFANGKVELIKFEVKKESPLCGVALKNMSSAVKTKALVCVVERGNETLIPAGDFTLWEGDKVSIVATGRKASEFFKEAGIGQGRVRTCMIMGGGDISYYVAEKLLDEGVEVKIVEKDKKKCEELAENLPNAIIIYGDGTDKGILEEEGISRTDGFVALTDRDEENVMMSICAKNLNHKVKQVTLVHRSFYDNIISDMEIGSIINPKLLAAEEIVKYVRAMSKTVGSNIETLYQISSGKVEALEFFVKEKSGVTDVPLMELKLKKNVLVACIVHKGQVETPKGSSVISVGDKVVIVTTETGFADLSDILR